jgi:hypothetical protein
MVNPMPLTLDATPNNILGGELAQGAPYVTGSTAVIGLPNSLDIAYNASADVDPFTFTFTTANNPVDGIITGGMGALGFDAELLFMAGHSGAAWGARISRAYGVQFANFVMGEASNTSANCGIIGASMSSSQVSTEFWAAFTMRIAKWMKS